MRIGIVPVTDPAAGGTYQYSLSLIDALCADDMGQQHDRLLFYRTGTRPPELSASWKVSSALEFPSLPRPKRDDFLRRALGGARAQRTLQGARQKLTKRWRGPEDYQRRRQPHLTGWLRELDVDLMLYSTVMPESFESAVPFLVAIHDLQHRLQPEFPEVSANGEWEVREYLFRNSARYALFILADSEVGKEDILSFYEEYGVTPDRIKVLPFQPAIYLATDVSESEKRRVRRIYGLPDRFLFYPANFWPHKNHIHIVEAIGRLKHQQNLDVHVVFTGTLKDELTRITAAEVSSIARELNIEHQIHRLGRVSNADISGLYAAAVGLVMPTFFGPTNIPVLEAWALGCPVLTSNIRGIREQARDAALLVDPASVDEIAQGIARLWEDEHIRRELIRRGHERVAKYKPEDFRRRLHAILEEAKACLRRA
jgi:glycosyltransferase involved in cell wall biosynthesis